MTHKVNCIRPCMLLQATTSQRGQQGLSERVLACEMCGSTYSVSKHILIMTMTSWQGHAWKVCYRLHTCTSTYDAGLVAVYEHNYWAEQVDNYIKWCLFPIWVIPTNMKRAKNQVWWDHQTSIKNKLISFRPKKKKKILSLCRNKERTMSFRPPTKDKIRWIVGKKLFKNLFFSSKLRCCGWTALWGSGGGQREMGFS